MSVVIDFVHDVVEQGLHGQTFGFIGAGRYRRVKAMRERQDFIDVLGDLEHVMVPVVGDLWDDAQPQASDGQPF